MGDRTSKKPPTEYIQDGDLYYQTGHGKTRHSGESNITFNASIDPSKPSGMYRFGKAIANAFNPVSVWHGINGIWKDKDVQVPVEKTILEERKVRAEFVYAEMKSKGYKGTRGVVDKQTNTQPAIIKHEDAIEPSREPFRDFRVDLDDARTSAEQNDGYISFNEQAFLSPPHCPEKCRSTSPYSDANTSIRSSLHLRKPSLQGLKKAASHVHLPLGKRSSFQGAVSSLADLPGLVAPPDSGLQSEPSRKDLARQFKLSKRVSDLESKLNVARRELTLLKPDKSPGPEVPPKFGIQPFKPGTLATLPSESLLRQSISGGTVKEEHDGDRLQEIDGSATGSFSKDEMPMTTGTLEFLNRDPIVVDEKEEKEAAREPKIKKTHQSVSTMAMPSKVAAEIEDTLRQKQPIRKLPPPVVSYYEPPLKRLDRKVSKSKPKESTSKKRKSPLEPRDEGAYRPSSDDDDVGWIATKITPEKNQDRAHKAVKTSLDDSPTRSKVTPKRNNQQKNPKSGTKSTTAIPNSLDQVKNINTPIVDKKKVMAMRSNPHSTAAFGTLSDDVINIKKLYPSISQRQLVDSMKPSLQSKISTDHTSVLHPNQETTSFLAPPHSAFTTKPKPKVSKHATPPVPHTEQTRPGAMEIVPEDAVITISPGKDENVPPMPSLGESFAQRATISEEVEGKMVPEVEFQWDDDVF